MTRGKSVANAKRLAGEAVALSAARRHIRIGLTGFAFARGCLHAAFGPITPQWQNHLRTISNGAAIVADRAEEAGTASGYLRHAFTAIHCATTPFRHASDSRREPHPMN